jgi:predicted small lipoprotein YifL
VGRNIDRWNRVALVAALGAGLALTACGRKSGLDTPSAALAAQRGTAGTSSSPGQEPNVLGSLFGGPPAPPPAPATPAGTPPPKKTFFLDPLIAK